MENERVIKWCAGFGLPIGKYGEWQAVVGRAVLQEAVFPPGATVHHHANAGGEPREVMFTTIRQ